MLIHVLGSKQGQVGPNYTELLNSIATFSMRMGSWYQKAVLPNAVIAVSVKFKASTFWPTKIYLVGT